MLGDEPASPALGCYSGSCGNVNVGNTTISKCGRTVTEVTDASHGSIRRGWAWDVTTASRGKDQSGRDPLKGVIDIPPDPSAEGLYPLTFCPLIEARVRDHADEVGQVIVAFGDPERLPSADTVFLT